MKLDTNFVAALASLFFHPNFCGSIPFPNVKHPIAFLHDWLALVMRLITFLRDRLALVIIRVAEPES